MRQTQNRKLTDFAFPLAMVIAFTVLIVGGWLILGDRLPAESIVVVAGVGVMGLFWNIASIDFNRREQTKAAIRTALAQEPALEPLSVMPTPTEPRVVTVIGRVGYCPRGLRVADIINIYADGKLSAPLCRTAIETLGPVLKEGAGGEGVDGSASCLCPIAGRRLTFDVRPTDKVLAS